MATPVRASSHNALSRNHSLDYFDESFGELLVEPSEDASVPKPLLRHSRRFIVGAALAIVATVAVASWKARCLFATTSGSVQGVTTLEEVVTLAEVSPEDVVGWDVKGEDQDAVIKWLTASSAAGSVAENAAVDENLAADTSRAVQEAMNTNDTAKARNTARKVMRRSLAKVQKSRKELGAFVQSQRRGLKKKKDEKSPSEKAATAACVFNVLQAVNSVAFVASNINDASRTCWGVHLSKEMFDKNNTHAKVCALNVIFAFAELANLAASLSIAADNCAATLVPNVDSLCAGAISGLIFATSAIAGSGVLIASACNDKFLGMEVPAGVVPSNVGSNKLFGLGPKRRLDAQEANVSAGGPAPARKLLFGGGKGSTATQCFIDVTGTMWSLAQAGIAINSAANPKAGKSCPPKNLAGGDKVKGPMYDVSEAFCTSDIGGILVGFTQAVALLQFLVVQCQDKLDLKAICGAGVDGIAAGMSAIVQAGSGANLACDKFQDPLLHKAIKTAAKLDTASGGRITDLVGGLSQSGNYGRRLEEDNGEDLDDDLKELQQRFKTPQDAFKSMGYDFDDPKAAWRSERVQRPNLKDLAELVEDHEDSAGLFGTAGCSAN
mmetsp:Transcript_60549/g.157356  ORF Transcript_60549/g.157356 Transcript_60549/m.157356 type:complete len:609 (+) Transcript_60549:81-1907(+)